MEEERILDLFFARSEEALRELDARYGKICRHLARGILGSEQDAEECVSDAYLGMWNAIPPQRPERLLPFLCRIVRNLSLARYHANTAGKRKCEYAAALQEMEDCLASRETVETQLAAEETARYIEEFLAMQSAENRVLFMRRYWFSDSEQSISERLGIPPVTVRVKLHRIRKKLKKHLEEGGYIR